MNTEILLTIKLSEKLFVDPKRIRLLNAIEECGSISQGAKIAKVSYKSAWDHLEAMDKISPYPLLERNIGGKNGGGTKLTAYAKRLLQLYELLAQIQAKAFDVLQDENISLQSLLSATATFSLQSSARNQFIGKVSSLKFSDINCSVGIEIAGLNKPLMAQITEKSAVRLGLVLQKEVLVMFKAPWVETYTDKPEQQCENTFQGKAIHIHHKGEKQEVIFAILDKHEIATEIEFCVTISAHESLQLNDTRWLAIQPEQILLATL